MSNIPGKDVDRNQEATIYIGNIPEAVSDAIIWELMLQAGPVSSVHLPKDRVSMSHQGFGFCEFVNDEDAEYACKIMNQIKLYGKPIRVNKASTDRKQMDVGANLFIGNLDPSVDERLLFDTFSTFGLMMDVAKIARDDTGYSKGYGFIQYNDFDSSDQAITAMNGQYLVNKPLTVDYAFKKDGKGERHGTDAERMLAGEAKRNNALPMPGAIPGQPFMQYQGMFAGALSGNQGAMSAQPPGAPLPFGFTPAPPPPAPYGFS
ncbi:hypothetical protein E3P92_01672 [Wallemia ichthyophaga]|uniref:Splicing factor 3B subunit 4 n=2 Tax=Wallemia ichthyophaga TaxID=245174 RepID=A0A4T0J965_WALIC|nr:Splicing factor 3B subunit 4 [Wallemia ichthyophaga EXF-994]TIA73422.1 hypothetical protein E3P91_01512 [Wallemia ichthyophaga]EOR00206.1 Splicing factor 3B subunit 4 [Wallemia ichthyophaga EXF-994]TIA81480.1 hypothetical protein E3P98_02042 [Wallemia ichthyophaga]TIA91732.1 hypothetical protein E3P97_01836 [Wallemia ichthyophaga]TIA96236.1 hypothetical protein E3P95_03349 [Wallemia ichthyophaga]